MLIKAIPLFFVGGLNILMGLLVFIRDSRKTQNFLFFLFASSLGGWVIGIGGFIMSNDPNIAFGWAKAYYSFPLIIAFSMPLFSRSFPSNSRIPLRWWLPILGGYILLAVPVLFDRNFVTARLVYHDWGKEILLNKQDYLLYSAYLLSCFGVGLVHTFIKSRRSRGFTKIQTRYYFIGFLLTSTFGVFFNLILPWVGNYRLIWLGPLFASAFVTSIGYSIVRHRTFDIRLVVARSLAYLFSITAVVLGYSAISVLVASRVVSLLGRGFSQQLVDTLLLVFVAITYIPIKRFFDRLTNRIFYRDAYDPQQFLDELNNVLVTNIEVNKLLGDTIELFERNLKSDFTVFSIRETSYFPRRIIGDDTKPFPEAAIEEIAAITPHIHSKVIITDRLDESEPLLKKILEKNDIAILVRLVATLDYEVGGVGYMLFGPKKSGNLYNKQDIRTLEIIANELVIAIQNALRFEEIEKFNATLQEKIDDATKKLQKSNEKLQTLDETKDEFISMASHQLRTPLTSVKGYLSMVLEGDAGEVTPMQHKMLDQALVSSQRMVYLIADLLNVSRLHTGKFVIESSPTNLAEVVEGEVRQLQNTAKSRGLELTYNKPHNFPTLILDETKIRQVIMNFMDNAIYYTPHGGHIQVELKDTDKTIEYRVSDDGMGVPKAEQHHLFTKFYRAGNAKKARPDGTGLGLFMSKKVIIAQGGVLIFTSQEGKGSSFGFSFEKAKLLPNPS